MCSQYLTNCASFAHSDCAISFSWCGVGVVQPVFDELRVVRAFGLRYLVLVVREDEVAAAAVDVDGLAEVFRGHGAALDVPAGASLAPRALPERLAGLRGLPEREVERALLALVDLDARAGVELFEALLRELAVLGEARHAEVDVAVRFIGVALFDKLLDDVDDCVDFVRRARVDGRAADAERVGVGVVFGDVFLRELGDGDAHLVRAVYHLVVDVGEVLHVGDFVAGRRAARCLCGRSCRRWGRRRRSAPCRARRGRRFLFFSLNRCRLPKTLLNSHLRDTFFLN